VSTKKYRREEKNLKTLKQGDDSKLRQGIEIAIKEVLEQVIGHPIHQRVLASTIVHTPLDPIGSGDIFQISLRVETHEKQKVDVP
jgi:hypothetical protein